MYVPDPTKDFIFSLKIRLLKYLKKELINLIFLIPFHIFSFDKILQNVDRKSSFFYTVTFCLIHSITY